MSDSTFSAPAGACNAPLRRELPQRRSVRLPEYDYGQAGWYFVTIMAKDGGRLFGEVTPEATLRYNPIGARVCQGWLDMAARYALLHADAWVLMPNHMHMILGVLPATETVPTKTLGQLVAAFKATTTRLARPLRASAASLWQRSYHEHIIRNAAELEAYRAYIQRNPRRWLAKKNASAAEYLTTPATTGRVQRAPTT